MINLNHNDRKELARKYGRVVKTITNYQLGASAEIFFDKDGMSFSAHLNGKFIQSKDGVEVEKWVAQKIKEACALKWMPVICVLDTEHGDYNYDGRELELHQISIDVNRFYIAALPDESVRAVNWDVTEEDRITSHDTPYAWVRNNEKIEIANGEIKLPLHSEQVHILPYTEPLWLGLNELMVGIDRLRTKLHDFLKTDEGVRKLQDAGAKMMNLLTQ